MNRQTVCRSRQPSPAHAAPSSGVLQRKCGCGRHTHGGGECGACRSKREAALQRTAGHTSAVDAVPPIVNEVLREPGAPLEPAVRAFFEPRFGRDFSGVRVHTNARASESAAAVGALAYTAGNHIVFAAGHYAPASPQGRRLLAHELTHVLQQDSDHVPDPASLRVGEPADAWERDAEAAADAIARGTRPAAVAGRPGQPVLQKTNGSGTGSAGAVCGPNVTKQLDDAIKLTESAFASWTTDQQKESCEALTSIFTGDAAWDIVELHNNAWILDYRPDCATQGQEPKCGSSIQVGNACHYAGSVNYVIFGVMCRLCYALYDQLFSSMEKPSWYESHWEYMLAKAMRDSFTRDGMLNLIDNYKGTGFSGFATPSTNFEASSEWARMGYVGWTKDSVGTPSGDRSNCHPVCLHVYGSVPTAQTGPFHVHWHPHMSLEVMRRRTEIPR
jgi:hypothetical protein